MLFSRRVLKRAFWSRRRMRFFWRSEREEEGGMEEEGREEEGGEREEGG